MAPNRHLVVNGTIHTRMIPRAFVKIAPCRKCGHVRQIDTRYGVCGVRSCFRTNNEILSIEPTVDTRRELANA